jgi:hypothetical protein
MTITPPADDGKRYTAAGTATLLVSDDAERTITRALTLACPPYVAPPALGITFDQPGGFTEIERRNLPFTTSGSPTAVRVTNLPQGWSVDVNFTTGENTGTFDILAPRWTDYNRTGDAFVLVTGSDGNVISRPLSLAAAASIVFEDTYSGAMINNFVNGYTLTIIATDGTEEVRPLSALATTPVTALVVLDKTAGKIIYSINISHPTYSGASVNLIGRAVHLGEQITYKIDNTCAITFRDPINNYIPINSYAEFQLINANTTTLSYHYLLATDLDLLGGLASPLNWAPIGPSTNPFTGTFDGDGHVVRNLYINLPTTSYVGLFGYVTRVVQNLGVASGTVTGAQGVGGVAGGIDYTSSISNCYNAAAITGTGNMYMGGVVGYNGGGDITACHNTGTVTGTSYVGGILGSGFNAVTITNCYNTGTVTGTGNVGGIFGNITSEAGAANYVTACYNAGAVTGTGSYVGGIGGGFSSGITIACYNTDTVTGTSQVGGVMGYNNGVVQACYNIGKVTGTGSYVGSVFGQPGGNLIYNYWHAVVGGATDGAATQFGEGSWPPINFWGVGTGQPGYYWKTLGGWYGGTPVFPILWWE